MPSRTVGLAATDITKDIVCVGSGCAGLSAAVAALDQGASVVVLEGAAVPGGTTGRSGGWFWVPNNSMLRAMGLTDSRDEALKFLASTGYAAAFNPNHPTLGLEAWQFRLLEAFYDRGPEVIDRLAALGALQPTLEIKDERFPYFSTFDWPDYLAHHPLNKLPVGRNFRSQPLDIPFPEHLTRLGAKGGWDLVVEMKTAVEKAGGSVLLEHKVDALLMDGDSVVGVRAVKADGKRVNVWARKGVVFGTGGFTHNAEMRSRFLPGHIYGGCAAPGAEGIFVTLGEAAGAQMTNINSAWWEQIPFERSIHDSTNENNLLGVPGDSMIMVNREGRRVVNEKELYHYRTPIHFVWDEEKQEYPNRILFIIFDQRTRDLWAGAPPMPAADVEDQTLIRADTLSELVEAVQARMEKLSDYCDNLQLDEGFLLNLRSTIKRFNGFASIGIDPDFQRGGHFADITRAGLAKPDHGRNYLLHEISDEGPYYCLPCAAAVLDTNGGPRINERAEVIGTNGSPIPGLYGAGNCIGSPAGAAYWAGGTTIGLATTFGFIAGLSAAGEKDRLLNLKVATIVSGTEGR